MLKIKILPGENIERALKRYKRKVRKTKQMNILKKNQEFTKKSKQKRDELAKAVYRNQYLINQEE
ncbi:hypothetical protein GCM10011414_04450 [Croceivirga lutea]|uniref:small ribosomal subunit protein bS21 n=1 Tax=Croceivirga lutea TaxID=1775167 RepID=UPI0016399B5B|nr:bS21 family ribosomal protein [Croceivirga lutea]GGG38207.1 hypothetical protein GCM10011414_04450 [Croceivirga lutea]